TCKFFGFRLRDHAVMIQTSVDRKWRLKAGIRRIAVNTNRELQRVFCDEVGLLAIQAERAALSGRQSLGRKREKAVNSIGISALRRKSAPWSTTSTVLLVPSPTTVKTPPESVAVTAGQQRSSRASIDPR